MIPLLVLVMLAKSAESRVASFEAAPIRLRISVQKEVGLTAALLGDTIVRRSGGKLEPS